MGNYLKWQKMIRKEKPKKKKRSRRRWFCWVFELVYCLTPLMLIFRRRLFLGPGFLPTLFSSSQVLSGFWVFVIYGFHFVWFDVCVTFSSKMWYCELFVKNSKWVWFWMDQGWFKHEGWELYIRWRSWVTLSAVWQNGSSKFFCFFGPWK